MKISDGKMPKFALMLVVSVMLAGVPFGTPGSTNLLHVVTLRGDELERHSS